MLLGVSGGIAAYKAAVLARLCVGAGAEVQVVMTASAERFVGTDTFAALTGNAVHTSLWQRPGEVLHVRLAHDVDVVAVAPATANLISKLANGLADDLLTATLLESDRPLVLAPAMHTGMWEHPATRANVARLVERGAHLVGPAAGALAAGDEGVGRMAEPDEILGVIADVLGGPRDLAGRRFLVTAGPTYEPIDPVRFIGNRSSGKMGVAIAREAVARGAEVVLILGPGTVAPPPGARVVRASTAEEMRRAVLTSSSDVDVVVMAAAVADFRPKAAAAEKLKKEVGPPEILLEPTPDILRELGEHKGGRLLVGFAAETQDLGPAGRRKLREKRLDLIVVNRVGRAGMGFGAESSEAMLMSPDEEGEALRHWTKAELAAAVCDRVAAMLAASGREFRP